GRPVRPGTVRCPGARTAGQSDRNKNVPGRQTWARRGVAGGESDAGDRRGSRHSNRQKLPVAGAAFRDFILLLRELSGGKPVGFKFSLGHPWEFFGICKAMLETGITPDFIVVDGGEGGTGAAPIEFTDHIGTPLQEALLLVHNTLTGLNL